jgi:hypothetical protein
MRVDERLPLAAFSERLMTWTVTDWIGSTRGATSAML